MPATANLKHDLGSDRPIDKHLAREAAQWLMRMHPSAEPDAADTAACKCWRAAKAEHEFAWQRAQQLNQKFGIAPVSLGKATLNRPSLAKRREAIKTLALAFSLAPAAWLVYRNTPHAEWTAQYRTSTGEQRQITLADGSHIQLNTNSALDVAFDAERRLLTLHSGEILIETAADQHAKKRPFLVQTSDGLLRALGTRFIVRRRDAYSDVAVFEGAVEVRSSDTTVAPLVIEASQQTRFSSTQVMLAEELNQHAADWSHGVLYAEKKRLGDFAEELTRYRKGWVRCDPAVADLLISGSFQLADTDDILQALVATLPIRVTYYSRYLVHIQAA